MGWLNDLDRRWLPRWMLLAGATGVAAGVASAVFLHLLGWATRTQQETPWLLFLLPVAGAVMAWTYQRWGEIAGQGNNAILDEIHDDVPGTPLRMAPMILLATVGTHLFGGSAGREGTAVQMGGALAGGIGRALRIGREHRRVLLMCGIAAGFGSVFGTPLAGAVFGIEVLALGGMRYGALVPCLIASYVGDLTTRGLGAEHAHWDLGVLPETTVDVAWRVAVAAIAFGAAAALFAEATHLVDRTSRRWMPRPVVRTAVGGAAIVLVTLALGTRLYNGLGTELIDRALTGEGVPDLAFLAKIGLTALTIGVGFKGGEVTPLFAIGASLGWVLAAPLGLPGPYLAAIGFIAVFAAAANTPLTCVVLGVELFGGEPVLAFGIAVFVAYTLSGHRGIYASQRVAATKGLWVRTDAEGATVGSLRTIRVARTRQRGKSASKSGHDE
jgi:H+/Cl- antiporter ClcA